MSFTFQDKTGQEWDCTIDVPTIERVLDSGTCDLYAALDEEMKLYKAIMGDPRQLMGVVWAIILPQAEGLGVTIAEFKKRINGDVIEAMGEQFTRSLADFSPALKRGLILKGWEKGKAIEELGTKKASAMLDRVDPEKLTEARVTAVEKMLKVAEEKMLNRALQNSTDQVSAVNAGAIAENSASSPAKE